MGQGWPKIYLEGKWVSKFFFLYVDFYFILFYFFFDFGCSLEMFERNDYLYLEGKWVTIVFGGKMGQGKQEKNK